MTPEEVNIPGEFVILLEDYAGEDDTTQERFEQLREQISLIANSYGFKCRQWGTEQQMRFSLLDRAKFIAERHIETSA
jgi:hypothetical protein